MPTALRRLIRRHLIRHLAAPVRHSLGPLEAQLQRIEHRLDRLQESVGRVEARQLQHEAGGDEEAGWKQAEFRAFSQWGEDGLIQRLIQRLRLRQHTFVEFGADNFLGESNTRFLLTVCGWRGLVLDGSEENVRQLRRTAAYCNYDVRAGQAFLTVENINQTLTANGADRTLGLLSIDVDGNDFWLWRAIDVVRADVVVIEYNPRFGLTEAVVVPYDPAFARHQAHPSGFYYGASLEGMRRLGQKLGYRLVGCNRNGGNAFFVRDELCESSGLPGRTTAEAFAPASFSEAFGVERDGAMLKTTPKAEAKTLTGLGLPLLTIGEDGNPDT